MRPPLSLLLALTGACASAGKATSAAQAPAPAAPTAPATAKSESTSVERLQYPSTYARHPNPPVLIRNTTIMTATGQEIPNGSIVLTDGRIVAVGAKVDAPAGDRRRHHHHSGAPGLGEPDRGTERDSKAHSGAHGAGNEVPRRALRPEDGLRREPQARVRPKGRSLDTHGQHGGLPRRVHSGGVVSP